MKLIPRFKTGYKTPDWDPTNPYHYHTPPGEKVVVTYKKRKHLFQIGGKLGKSADLLRYGYSRPEPKVPFSDMDNKTWLNWWYGGREKQLKQSFSTGIQKYIDEAVETPIEIVSQQPKDKPGFGGAYNLITKTIKLYPHSKVMNYNEGRDLLFHEQVHALNDLPTYKFQPRSDEDSGPVYPPEDAIINLGLSNKDDYDYYWDDNREIYSRLMEFRKQNKLHPSKYQDKEQIKKWRDSGKLKQFMLDRYDDDTLLYLFNEVAQNNSTKNAGYYAAKGAKLISRE